MKDKFLYILLLTILLAITSFAQELLTLDEAVKLALNNNNYLQITKNSEDITNNNFSIGNAGFLPTVDLTGTSMYNDQELNVNGIKTSTKSTTNSANISANLMLFDGLSRFYNYNKLEKKAENGTLQNQQQKELVVNSVIASYYNVARANDLLKTAEEALGISNERLLRTEKKMEFGQVGKIDFLNARVDFNADSVNYINTKTFLSQAKQNLNIILNREIYLNFTVVSEVAFDSLPTISEMLKMVERNNTEKLISDNNIKLAEQDVNLSYSNYFPTLSLRASYGYNGLYDDFQIAFDDPNKSFTTTLNLGFNLFNGFRDNIQRQNAEIMLDNSKLLNDQTKKEINNEVISAYQSYRDSRTILEMETGNLEAAEANFARTKELYDLGKITNTEFRQAQLKLIQAKNNISSAKYNAKNYETELKRLTGILLGDNSL
ncbi:MAG: TolC family protein [Bacteroidetes bacterium]|nr:TolC family protein [Bacteroidota bacterium]